MKFYCIRPVLWEIYGHTGTGKYTDIRILGNDTTYVVCPSLTTSNPRICGGITPCDRSMWCLIDEASTDVLHSEKLTLLHLLTKKITPYSVTFWLYASSPIWHNMIPGVQTIAFVLSNFVSRPTL